VNKKFIQVSIAVLFLITACSQPPAKETPAATSIFVTAVDAGTLIRTPAYAATPIPTETPTASITPLPTIPTFTPTFDVARIVTVTPPPKAECPKENPSVVAKFTTPNSDGSYEHYRASDIVDYLNSGGTSAQLKDSGIAETIDLTNDGVNEVVYEGLFKVGISILGCKDGNFQDLLDFG